MFVSNTQTTVHTPGFICKDNTLPKLLSIIISLLVKYDTTLSIYEIYSRTIQIRPSVEEPNTLLLVMWSA